MGAGAFTGPVTVGVATDAALTREVRPIASPTATTVASRTRDTGERSVRIMNTSETPTVFLHVTEHNGGSVIGAQRLYGAVRPGIGNVNYGFIASGVGKPSMSVISEAPLFRTQRNHFGAVSAATQLGHSTNSHHFGSGEALFLSGKSINQRVLGIACHDGFPAISRSPNMARSLQQFVA